MRRLLALSLILLVGCTIDANGIRIDVPQWNRHTTVVPPRPDETKVDPLPQGQMRALIIEDRSPTGSAKLTPAQRTMLNSVAEGSMRSFLKENCVNEGFRLVDKETELSGVWAELKSKHPPASYPWMIFSSGDKSEAVPLNDYPTALLNKYAGVKQ